METINPVEIWIEESVYSSPLAQRIRERAGESACKVIGQAQSINDQLLQDPAAMTRGRRILVVARMNGPFFKACPCSGESVHCGSDMMNVAGCSSATSYCLLQSSTNNPTVVVYANLEDLATELDQYFRENPGRQLRVGVGESCDSLDLEPLTGYAADLVRVFSQYPNATLELRTRGDSVDGLIGLDPGRAVISWTITCAEASCVEDKRSATLAERLDAASRVAEAGYKVGFHFDPMIHFPGWQESYADLLDRVEGAVHPNYVEWISLGALRFAPALKGTMERRFPSFSESEFVIADGRMRYFPAIRTEMFCYMAEQIRRRYPDTMIYLCMEPPEIWQKVLGREPRTCQIIEDPLGDTG